MKRISLPVIVLLAWIISLLLPSCKSHKKETGEETPTVDVALPLVDSVTLHKEYPGTLAAHEMVDLVARVDGYLRSQNYQAGQSVSAGQVLFTIEDSKYRDAVVQAQAELATAKSAYSYASDHYAAVKKALESDAVSQMEVTQAESNMNQSAASIRNAQAALQSAQTSLGYCVVRAPFAGKVTKSPYSPGAYLAGAAAPVTLATIYDDDYLFAYFAIDDGMYLQMVNAKGGRADKVSYDSIRVTFSEELPHKYYGNLNYMAPEIDSSTGTMKLRVRLDNPYGELKDGMYAKIALPYAVDPKAILVKDASISTDQLGKYLYIVNDSNMVVYTPIEVGELVNDSLRIVTKGITPKDRYVTKALLKVRNGMEVKPRLNGSKAPTAEPAKAPAPKAETTKAATK
ncbi:MAG: efflux RND transporter periplasmic adaptor subunit [Bacteroidales bacterium]|nr:efflux RND transporter periplasmic adaptor subunit [Bacteroidales bacterium]